MLKLSAAIWMLAATTFAQAGPPRLPRIVVSPNHRYLQTSDGAPFFWLADTGWLLFQELDRPAAERYLEDRRQKGFNVVQAMVLHTAGDANVYGAVALTGGNPATPKLTPANGHTYWDHLDWVIDRAAEKGLYMALVPAWGSLAKSGALNEANVAAYSRFLAERYRSRSNIFWLTGGDILADRNLEVWRTMGRTLRANDPNHPITYHPFGRTSSSQWFHTEPWLDFDMFQSGHRSYEQDAATPGTKGEDNWRYVREDLARSPAKPTLDGEPSYEGIPHGLHDTSQPYWEDRDCRRYAYWAVFAGAFGHTYGHNAVMQMHKPDSRQPSFGPRSYWYQAIGDPGAGQMRLLKRLMLSRPFFERVPDQNLVAGSNGTRYEYVIATRGRQYAFYYTYTGRPFTARLGTIAGQRVRAWWYDPRTGAATAAGEFANQGERRFTPPGTPAPGNDWVLVLDDAATGFPAPAF
jgi:hypothetical protein